MRTVSVVLAARNEASTIYQTLRGLSEQTWRGTIHVAVCVNGSSDRTAEEVRRAIDHLSPQRLRIDLLLQAKPGRAEALNAAEALVEADSVRIYLDADVSLSANAVAAMMEALDSSAALVAAPRRIVIPSGSFLVDLFAKCLMMLPWVHGEIMGGAFGVNRAGRQRWAELPPVASDDTYVIWHFAPAERRLLSSCTAAIRFPRSLRELLRQQRRWMDGRDQLVGRDYDLRFRSSWPRGRRCKVLLTDPRLLFAMIVVTLVRLVARVLMPRHTGTSYLTRRYHGLGHPVESNVSHQPP